MNEETALLDL